MIKMMTKAQDSLSEMAHARQSDGISVIFDQDLPTSSTPPESHVRSGSRSSRVSSSSSGSSRRPREAHRRRRRSSSSSSSTSSSPRRSSRSRSHPRCHRPASRCRCGSHHRYPNRDHRRRRSPPRRSRSTSRSHSKSDSKRTTYRKVSRSPSSSSRGYRSRSGSRSSVHSAVSKSYRSRSGSRSSGHYAVSDKRDLLRTATANAAKIVRVEQLEVGQGPAEAESAPAAPEASWVRPDRIPQRTPSQSSDTESDEDVPTPMMSSQRRIISFSINNSVAKPTVASLSSGKVTPRMDSIESRKPYGHWVPVRKMSRKHRPTTSC